MALLDIVDPGWKDDIVPTVALTEGGRGIEFAEDGLTVDNAAHQTPSEPPQEEEAPPQTEVTEVTQGEEMPEPEMPEVETPAPEPQGTSEGITLTPDSDTVIIPEGAQLQVTPNGGNAPAGNNGQTLYQFNVKKDANGNYVQQ